MKDLFDIGKKVIVVTGATGVLAGATARYLASCGARVAFLGRNEEKLEEARAYCAENGFEGLDDRLSVFYEKIIDAETKSDNESTYLTHTKELFEIIYKDVFIEKRKKEETKGKNVNKEPAEPDIHRIISNFYSMLRMAKFIKGEGVKDE